MPQVRVYGTAGSGRSSLCAALRAHGIDAVEADFGFSDALGSDGLTTDAVMVLAVSAKDGLDTTVAPWWERQAEAYCPRLLVWTFTDVGRADDDDLRAICERVLGEPTYALALPLADDDEEFAGILDLRDGLIHESRAGDTVVRPADAEHDGLAAPLRDDLIDAALALTHDDAAVTTRLAGLSLNAERLSTLVTEAAARGELVLSMPVRAIEPHIGIDVLSGVLTAINAQR